MMKWQATAMASLQRKLRLMVNITITKTSKTGFRWMPTMKSLQAGKVHFSAALFLMATMCSVFSSALAMTEMPDSELSDISGQALMQMGKQQGTGISNDITFYKAGLDVELEINMNIKKLQLGCTAGSINGQFCDIDIDNMSLSGSTLGPDGRPASAALLTRPFFRVRNQK